MGRVTEMFKDGLAAILSLLYALRNIVWFEEENEDMEVELMQG